MMKVKVKVNTVKSLDEELALGKHSTVTIAIVKLRSIAWATPERLRVTAVEATGEWDRS